MEFISMSVATRQESSRLERSELLKPKVEDVVSPRKISQEVLRQMQHAFESEDHEFEMMMDIPDDPRADFHPPSAQKRIKRLNATLRHNLRQEERMFHAVSHTHARLNQKGTPIDCQENPNASWQAKMEAKHVGLPRGTKSRVEQLSYMYPSKVSLRHENEEIKNPPLTKAKKRKLARELRMPTYPLMTGVSVSELAKSLEALDPSTLGKTIRVLRRDYGDALVDEIFSHTVLKLREERSEGERSNFPPPDIDAYGPVYVRLQDMLDYSNNKRKVNRIREQTYAALKEVLDSRR